MSAYNKLAHKMASQSFGVPKLGLPHRQLPDFRHGPLLKPKTRPMPKGMRGYFS